MAAELHDVRAKVTSETWCAITSEVRASGKDQSQIVREVLHWWALQKIQKASVLARLLKSKGIDGALEGALPPEFVDTQVDLHGGAG